MKSFTSMLAVALCAALSALASVAHARSPGSVQALLQALPELPTDAEQAAAWFDKSGRLVHPPLLQLQAAIADHQKAMQRIALAQGRADTAQGQVLADNVVQGLQGVGIDAQRMQADPAYARQVQERLRRMTPAEQMVMAQRMAQPLNQDPRVINPAAAMAQDAPAARTAAEVGQAYVQAQAQRQERHAALWAETEKLVQQVRARPRTEGLPRPAIAWGHMGCDKRCQAQWDAYSAQALPKWIARESEILVLRRASVQRQRAALSADMATADQHLMASEFGLVATSSVHRRHIVAYDAALVAELVRLIDRTIDVAERAAAIPRCGVQVVLLPGVACR